jgi:hypothetical protein
MIVVTPSKVESFVMLKEDVLGNRNGLGTLIQKDRRKSGTYEICSRLSSNSKNQARGFY